MVSDVIQKAAERISRETWLDELAYASMQVASAKFFPQREREPVLSVALLGDSVEAWDSASISLALQSATARIGALLRDPKREHLRKTARDRELATLVQKGSTGTVTYFGFPEPQISQDTLMADEGKTLAELAARELVDMLPRSADDWAAIDSLLSRRKTERAAISDLVDVISQTENSIELRLLDSRGDDQSSSVVTLEQASAMRDTLSQKRTETSVIECEGFLDGMRTTRRIFYLDLEDGRTLSGAIDADMIESVKSLIGRQVIATLEVTTIISENGRRGRDSYKLVALKTQMTID